MNRRVRKSQGERKCNLKPSGPTTATSALVHWCPDPCEEARCEHLTMGLPCVAAFAAAAALFGEVSSCAATPGSPPSDERDRRH
mmetsp:Transcript_84182/g.176171  ORF Transcript_84182/g.176171 Transcript_84182/m.176171 type:complete len:84 (+) Transcript_84182:392-643(+)